jgi:16S rRNA (adenine1518-N6/adenine1519-N6)-dimethyltransferase
MNFPLGFKPKKSLGQSFLISNKIADKLVEALELKPTDNVLEIGAGFGVLTTRIAERAHKVIAVELDERLIPFLQENVKTHNNVEIINQDILKLDWQKLGNIKIIGNIPYNISSEILKILLDNINIWNTVVLTMQRELTNKLNTSPGKSDYCAMTVLFDFYTERKKLFSIPASQFRPSPKITSVAIVIKKRSSHLFADINFDIFSKVVQASFKQPRKTISNNLSIFLDINKSRLVGIKNLNLNQRAETFSVYQFYQLAKELWK